MAQSCALTPPTVRDFRPAAWCTSLAADFLKGAHAHFSHPNPSHDTWATASCDILAYAFGNQTAMKPIGHIQIFTRIATRGDSDGTSTSSVTGSRPVAAFSAPKPPSQGGKAMSVTR